MPRFTSVEEFIRETSREWLSISETPPPSLLAILSFIRIRRAFVFADGN